MLWKVMKASVNLAFVLYIAYIKDFFFQFCYTLFWKICINAFINVQRDCVKFMNIMFCFKNRLGINLDAYKETKEYPIENYVT